MVAPSVSAFDRSCLVDVVRRLCIVQFAFRRHIERFHSGAEAATRVFSLWRCPIGSAACRAKTSTACALLARSLSAVAPALSRASAWVAGMPATAGVTVDVTAIGMPAFREAACGCACVRFRACIYECAGVTHIFDLQLREADATPRAQNPCHLRAWLQEVPFASKSPRWARWVRKPQAMWRRRTQRRGLVRRGERRAFAARTA